MNGTKNTKKIVNSIRKKKDLMQEVGIFCRQNMYLSKWTLNWSYPQDNKNLGDNQCVHADIDVDHKYYEAHINIYPALFEQSGDVVFSVILHEISHIITDEQQTLAYKPLNNEFVSEDQIETANEKATTINQVIVESLIQRGPQVHKEYQELMKKLSKVFK